MMDSLNDKTYLSFDSLITSTSGQINMNSDFSLKPPAGSTVYRMEGEENT